MYSKKNNRKEKIDYLMFKPLNENRISNIKKGGWGISTYTCTFSYNGYT